jgi:hypothetical protein
MRRRTGQAVFHTGRLALLEMFSNCAASAPEPGLDSSPDQQRPILRAVFGTGSRSHPESRSRPSAPPPSPTEVRVEAVIEDGAPTCRSVAGTSVGEAAKRGRTPMVGATAGGPPTIFLGSNRFAADASEAPVAVPAPAVCLIQPRVEFLSSTRPVETHGNTIARETIRCCSQSTGFPRDMEHRSAMEWFDCAPRTWEGRGESLVVVLVNSHSVSLARHRSSAETGARHRDLHHAMVAEAVASATKETRSVTRAIGSVAGMRQPMAIVDWPYYSCHMLPGCKADTRDLGCSAAWSPRR